jgi:hypothetical protein
VKRSEYLWVLSGNEDYGAARMYFFFFLTIKMLFTFLSSIVDKNDFLVFSHGVESNIICSSMMPVP